MSQSIRTAYFLQKFSGASPQTNAKVHILASHCICYIICVIAPFRGLPLSDGGLCSLYLSQSVTMGVKEGPDLLWEVLN